MARQSRKKRAHGYQARRDEESVRLTALLQRQAHRLESGQYDEKLTSVELTRMRDLLFAVLMPDWRAVNGRPVLVLASLEAKRRAYYGVCRILRRAGPRIAHEERASHRCKIIRHSSRS